MRTGVTVELNAQDRQRLVAIVADRNSPQKHVWRAQIVLLTADGCGTAEIMRRGRQTRAPSVRSYPPSCSPFQDAGEYIHCLSSKLFNLAAAGHGRRHDHQTTVD